MKNKKEKLVITGDKKYIDYMYAHLKEEHPSTKRKMRLK
jgi:hypothetical protein